MSKILILGCGPSGMMTALALSKYGIKSTILEKAQLSSRYFENDVRNYALTTFSRNFLKKMNVWDHLKNEVALVRTVYVADNRSSTILEMDSVSLNVDSLGYMIPSSTMKQILFFIIKNNNFIELRDSTSYSDIKFDAFNTNVMLDNGTAEKVDLVLTCDGKFSFLRKKYFGNRVSKRYNEIALTFNIEHSNSHEGSALEHFIPHGVFAALPCKSMNQSSIVWSEQTKIAQILQRLDKDQLIPYIYDKLGSSYGDIKIISDIASYPITASITDKYFYKNITLLADSAHSIHPLAGQGLNQGIKDIESITRLIHQRHILGLELDEYMLEEYEKERQQDNMKMFHITNSINRIFTSRNPILSLARQTGLAILNNTPMKTLLLQ